MNKEIEFRVIVDTYHPFPPTRFTLNLPSDAPFKALKRALTKQTKLKGDMFTTVKFPSKEVVDPADEDTSLSVLFDHSPVVLQLIRSEDHKVSYFLLSISPPVAMATISGPQREPVKEKS